MKKKERFVYMEMIINSMLCIVNSTETVMIGDNVSYIISSTGRITSARAVDDIYSSSLSLASMSSKHQPLPPTPLAILKVEKGVERTETEREHIYDTCK